MRTLTFLAALGLILSAPCLAQTQIFPDGYLMPTSPGAFANGKTSGTTTTYFVDTASGSDNNACTTSGAPCKTVSGACTRLLPAGGIIQGPIDVVIDGGTYSGGGCRLEGLTFKSGANGAWLRFVGLLNDVADAGSGCPTTGTVTAGTNLSNNSLPTFTQGTNCWASAGLVGYLAEIIHSGTSYYMPITSNTGTVVTGAGQLPITPTNGDTYHIRDPYSVNFTGGLTMTTSTPAAQYNNTAASAQTSIFIASGINSAVNSPVDNPVDNAQNATNTWANIYFEKLGSSSATVMNFVTSRDVPGIALAWCAHRITGGPVGTAASLLSSSGGMNSLIGNIVNYKGISPGTAAMFGSNPGAFTSYSIAGNFLTDSLYNLTTANGFTGPQSPVFLVSVGNVVSNPDFSGAGSTAILNGTFEWADLRADQFDNGGSSNTSCMNLGGSTTAPGTGDNRGSIVRIRGGQYQNCGAAGQGAINVQGGTVLVNGGASLATTGTTGNSGFGFLVAGGGNLQVTASSSTLTGSQGNYSIDGSNAIAQATLTTLGQVVNVENGAVLGTASPTKSSLVYSFADTSGTPGNGTANTTHGRSAIAATGTAATITNSFVTSSASQVTLQLETKDTGCTSLYVTTIATGSFVATCNIAAVGTTKFSWAVGN